MLVFLIRNPSYPCGWAVQSSVWGSCQPMSVWPGRLGRLVHARIKTFSVFLRNNFLRRVLFLLHPDTISHLLHVVLEINTQMRVEFVWRPCLEGSITRKRNTVSHCYIDNMLLEMPMSDKRQSRTSCWLTSSVCGTNFCFCKLPCAD